jgi:hypothetical protein
MLTYGLAPYRGDTHRWRFVLWADPGRTVAVDLTGVVVKAEIRSAPGGSFVAALGCTVTLPQTIDVALTAAQSATLPPSAAWDLQLTWPSGDVQTVVKGSVTASGDVTDAIAIAGVCR